MPSPIGHTRAIIGRSAHYVYESARSYLTYKGGVDGTPLDTFENRRAKAHAPEFSSGAKISVKERTGKGPMKKDEQQIVLSFPAAHGTDSLSRPFDYEVRAEYVEGDVIRPMCTKRIYQPGVQWSVKRDAKTVTCVFGACELPSHKLRFAVTPLNSLGQRGRPLYLERA